jgi:multiple sugar transport system ATP-binding protein
VAELRLEGVSKTYPSGLVAVRNVSLTVADGELVVLVGPSGCGKSTILRMISGLETVTEGRILLDGRPIDKMSESARDIAMIFQNYALYPHLSVYNNIGFPLKLARMPRRERDARIREVAQTLGLTPYLDSKPGQLSGGQRQRAAMGRAIVRRPKTFLMDEPLSNLDAKLRAEMRTELSELQRRLATTMIYVTHDQAEAMTLGDRVAVLNNGSLLQVGTPDEIYARPDDLFVAGCLGNPTINTFTARLESGPGSCQVVYGDQRLQLDQQELRRHRIQPGPEQDVIVGIRPEALQATGDAPAAGGGRVLTGTVVKRESLGSDVLAFLDLSPAKATGKESLALFDERPDDSSTTRPAGWIVARLPADSSVTEAQRLGVTVAANALHLFDPATGAAWARARPGAAEPELPSSAPAGQSSDRAG